MGQHPDPARGWADIAADHIFQGQIGRVGGKGQAITLRQMSIGDGGCQSAAKAS